jgi:hypothetical protein
MFADAVASVRTLIERLDLGLRFGRDGDAVAPGALATIEGFRNSYFHFSTVNPPRT